MVNYLSSKFLFVAFFFSFNRLLDREQVRDEEATVDDDEEDGFLKAFKVLSMLYYSVHFYLCASSDLRYALFIFHILAYLISCLYSFI